ncbi:hypothetical protein PHABIO_172 [Pseudomonas phage Phabio]|uniref:Uncharacterized protein n=1 Tax=Pseudomonas phage Phabio TaxID=2006668 RepID=A0A1Y0SYI1_9CAUD|nr:hypothetical protein MZD05_gp172 [Pseudomonas phage Phabio]ARV76803.1 hypothetical protein PHABIO_172 [Pseudomonas phage Phabio]
MCQKLGKRKAFDRLEQLREYYKQDTYEWYSLVNVVYLGVRFHGSSDEFCYYLDKRKAREKYLSKLWRYHNRTNPLRLLK